MRRKERKRNKERPKKAGKICCNMRLARTRNKAATTEIIPGLPIRTTKLIGNQLGNQLGVLAVYIASCICWVPAALFPAAYVPAAYFYFRWPTSRQPTSTFGGLPSGGLPSSGLLSGGLHMARTILQVTTTHYSASSIATSLCKIILEKGHK